MSPMMASGGPPPPEARPVGGNGTTPPMPPSMIADQGQLAEQQQQQDSMATLSKKVLEMAVQKLMEVNQAIDGLNTSMKTLDPSSDSLMVPMKAAWQGVASKIKEIVQRAQAQQPNMAGMSTPGATTGSPAGGAGPAEAAAGQPPEQGLPSVSGM